MVAVVIVVIDEGADLALKIIGQVIVFQQNPVLHRLMPAFDLALGLPNWRQCLHDITLMDIFDLEVADQR